MPTVAWATVGAAVPTKRNRRFRGRGRRRRIGLGDHEHDRCRRVHHTCLRDGRRREWRPGRHARQPRHLTRWQRCQRRRRRRSQRGRGASNAAGRARALGIAAGRRRWQWLRRALFRGVGGSATIGADAVTASGTSAYAMAIQTGGQGGAGNGGASGGGASGGVGASSTLINAVSGSAPGGMLSSRNSPMVAPAATAAAAHRALPAPPRLALQPATPPPRSSRPPAARSGASAAMEAQPAAAVRWRQRHRLAQPDRRAGGLRQVDVRDRWAGWQFGRASWWRPRRRRHRRHGRGRGDGIQHDARRRRRNRQHRRAWRRWRQHGGRGLGNGGAGGDASPARPHRRPRRPRPPARQPRRSARPAGRAAGPTAAATPRAARAVRLRRRRDSQRLLGQRQHQPDRRRGRDRRR